MKRQFLFILFISLLNLNLWAQDGASWWNTDYNTTEGTEFWVTFMFNYGNTEEDLEDLSLKVFATARDNANVKIQYGDKSYEEFTVNAYERAIHTIDLSKGYITDAKMVLKKGIQVLSDKPISLYAVSQNSIAGSQDATCIFPKKALHKEYVIQTYGTDGVVTEFAIVATNSTQNIKIEIQETNTIKDSTTTEIVNTGSMQEGDVYLYRSRGSRYSLSGTKICADIPIAVFQGGQHADIPFGASNKNHIYAQAAPTNMWGREYIAPISYNQTYDYLRLTTVSDNTTIYKYNGNNFLLRFADLQSRTTVQDSIYSPSQQPLANVYRSNKDIECFVYLTDYNQNASNLGAPAMALISPITNGMNSLVFPTLDANNIQQHYCNVVTYKNCVNNLILNSNKTGDVRIASYFHDILGTPYAFAQIPLEEGSHFLRSTSRSLNDIFIVNVYGLGKNNVGRRESYAYAAGSRINSSLDLLINDQYVKETEICINEDPIKFSADINYDYDEVIWKSHLFGDEVTSGSNDSILYKDYHLAGTDTLELIVRRTTPLCEYIMYDTVKAIIQVHDTAHIDEVGEDGSVIRNICYGNTFNVHYKDNNGQNKTYTYVADTSIVQNFKGQDIKFELNKEYCVVDSFLTIHGCDSTIWQRFILRPTFDTTIRDTLCYQSLPYQWRDGSGRKVYTLTTEDLVQKSNLHLTEENVFLVDSIVKDTTLTTQYGCDSAVHITWLVLPDYNIPVHKDVCADTIDTHYKEWSGHISEETGKVLPGHHLQFLQNNGVWKDVNYIDISTAGTFTYRDVLKTTAYRCKQCEDNVGCDSIWTLTLNVIKHEIELFRHTMCDDESYLWEDTLRLGPKCPAPPEGTIFKRYDKSVMIDVQHSTTKALECDSTYRLLLQINPTYLHPTLDTICDTELPYEWRLLDSQGTSKTITFNPSKKSEDIVIDSVYTLRTIYGCDSVVTLHLVIHPTFYYEESVRICQDSIWSWGTHDRVPINTTLVGSRNYYDSLPTVFGCDSVYLLHLIVDSVYLRTTDTTLCEGDSILWDGQYWKGRAVAQTDTLLNRLYGVGYKDTVITHSYQTQVGVSCDSTEVLNLTIIPREHKHQTEVLCDYDSYVLGDSTILARPAGFYHDIYIKKAPKGCTTVYSADVTVNASSSETRTIDTCRSAIPFTYIFGDTTCIINHTDGTQMYELHTPTISNCDSVLFLNVHVLPTYLNTDNKSMCDNDTIEWEHRLYVGSNYKGSYDGSRFDKVINNLSAQTTPFVDDIIRSSIHGCDSVSRLQLTINPTYQVSESVAICDTELPYEWRLSDSQGTSKTILFNPSKSSEDIVIDSVCTLRTIYGCDSVVTLHLVIHPTFYYEESARICQNSIWSWGTHDRVPINTTLVGSRNYYDSLPTVFGCDSVYLLHLIVDSVYLRTTDTTLCEGDSILWDGQYWKGRAVVQTDTLLNRLYGVGYKDTVITHSYQTQVGVSCDSTEVLNLTIIPREHKHQTEVLCDYDSYVLGDSTILARPAGFYHDIYIKKAPEGCTTVYSADVTVNASSSETRTIDTCRSAIPFSYNFGDTTCIINHTDGTQMYELHTPTKNNCDSVLYLTVHVWPTYDTPHTITICEGDSVYWENKWRKGKAVEQDNPEYAQYFGSIKYVSEDYTESYITKVGLACDSIERLQLIVNPRKHTPIVEHICDNESYMFGGQILHEHSEGVYYDTLHLFTTMGCDSVLTLILHVHPTWIFTQDTMVCQDTINKMWEWIDEMGGSHGKFPIDKTGWFVYGDSLKTQYGCDSIFGVRLHVTPTYYIHETNQICDNDSVQWQRRLYVGPSFDAFHKVYDPTLYDSVVRVNIHDGILYDTIHYATTEYGCDSVYYLELSVLSNHFSIQERNVCQDDDNVVYEAMHNGASGIVPTQIATDITYWDTIPGHNGCDSVIQMTYHIWPVYQFNRKDSICQTYNGYYYWIEGDVLQDSISIDKGDTTIFGGSHYTTIHGCDSTFGIELYVKPIYHFYDTLSICESDSVSWQGVWYGGSQFDAYHPEGRGSTTYRRMMPNLVAQRLIDTAYYQTHLLCDSVYHLCLDVYEVPHVTIHRRYCQSAQDYWYECRNRGAGGYLPSQWVGEYVYVDTIQTVLHCDSIVTLIFHVDSVYDYRQTVEICQDTIDKQWPWFDDDSIFHKYIDRSVAGTFNYVESYKTIYGCDSIYGLTITIHPIYRFDSIYHICENERVTWQHRTYTGDSVALLPEDTIVLEPGIYYDTAHYYTTNGCDSTYYVVIHIHPIYDTLSIYNGCYNETFIWEQKDHLGTYADEIWTAIPMDTVLLSADEAMQPQAAKDTFMRSSERMLRTINNCDSMSHLKLTIHPSYFFYTDTTICANEKVYYRGRTFVQKDTTFTEYLKTKEAGCDSIYQLHLHVKPAYMFHRFVSTCDNDVLYHPSLNGREIIWDSTHSLIDTLTDATYPTIEGCDSVYRYHITIHPTYFYSDTVDFCSGELYPMHDHLHVGLDTIYDPIISGYVHSVDTLYKDSLSSIYGCDSVYWLQAHINPQYSHIDYDTICDDGVTMWRGHTYYGNKNIETGGDHLSEGNYVFYDSFSTVDGCDSIFEFRLCVHPTYLNEKIDTICSDEHIIWQYRTLDNLPSGWNFLDTTYTTIFGCDSTYHLQLLVLDTTAEVIYDTICVDSVYTLYGKTYTQTGFYKDTTINDWGCHNFVYLYLTVIQPTKYWLNIPDICADEDEIEIGYSYEGQPIVDFSVLFDSLGHAQGFEDINHQPISDYEQQRIYIPIPHKEALLRPNPTYFDSQVGVNDSVYETKFAYPEPNDYHVRVILGNGYCPDDKQTKDTVWKIYYPSWIHEQHWNDGIVLYNEIYNGNYTFSHYQWYWNDEPIIGQVREFLYWPDSLHLNQRGEIPCVNEYKVELTRESDGYTTFTCPICPVQIYDHIVPKMDYFSIVPTLVVKENPVVWILTTKPLSYQVWDCAGGKLLMSKTHVIPDANNYAGAITLPVSGEGVICVELRTDDGESRTFKILVK